MAGGASFEIRLDDSQWRTFEKQARALAAEPGAMLDDMGDMLVGSTQLRFDTGTDPDGNPWPPSLRAKLEGGKTLVDDGHLRDSITHQVDGNELVVGTNIKKYPATHQFGAQIAAKNADFLAFTVGGRHVRKKEVTIPARPFLGASDADRQGLVRIFNKHIERMVL